MANTSDDHLAQFRLQSDRAFFEMQQRADREMASFLQRYGRAGVLPEIDTRVEGIPRADRSKGLPSHGKGQAQKLPNHGAGQQAGALPGHGSGQQRVSLPGHGPAPQQAPAPQQVPSPQAAPATQNPNISPPAADTDSFYETVAGVEFGALSQEKLAESADDLREDARQLSDSLREESRAAARQALRGTSDIIKNSASDLGRRAKEEAAALRDAARRAREEEKSLKALRGRANVEVEKAKDRVKSQLEEVKDEAIEDLSELAADSLEALKGKAVGLFQQGQEAIQRELEDLGDGPG